MKKLGILICGIFILAACTPTKKEQTTGGDEVVTPAKRTAKTTDNPPVEPEVKGPVAEPSKTKKNNYGK
jgi:hypothetical protein